MIVRPVEIHQFIAEIFQNRQRGWRTIDELPIRSSRGESPLQDQIVLASFDPGFDKLWVKLLQIFAAKDRFHSAQIGGCANQRFIRAFAQ